MNRLLAAGGFLLLVGCGGHTGDAGNQNIARVESLSCDPNDTWEVLSAASAGVTTLNNIGDSEFASAAEVGDGLNHLFVGVAHEEVTDANTFGAVFIHDATSPEPGGTYTLPPEPIVSQRDSYDQYGIEVPSYLRYDAHTELIYYCALYTSNAVLEKGQIAALQRIDGGAWQKLGIVAPFGAGSTSQCEPDAALDPETGAVHLFFAALDGQDAGLKHRVSVNPRSFPAEGETTLTHDYTRITTSRDPFNNLYRFALDGLPYPYPNQTGTWQSWSASLPLDDTMLQAHAEVLHEGAHGLHPNLHTNSASSVLMAAGAAYVSPSEILFFYTGLNGQKANMRTHAQRCRPKP